MALYREERRAEVSNMLNPFDREYSICHDGNRRSIIDRRFASTMLL